MRRGWEALLVRIAPDSATATLVRLSTGALGSPELGGLTPDYLSIRALGDEPWRTPCVVKELVDGLAMAYDAYVSTVGTRLSDAFYRDGCGHLLADADSLAKVAVVCELEGPGALQALEPHLEREWCERQEAMAKTTDKSKLQEWKRTDTRLKEAREMLCRPTLSLKLRFAESMPSIPLP
eukprot:1965355-Prymnesium_polylepis.2